MEVVLQWVDELDDLLGAARQRLAAFGYRVAGLWE